MERNKLLKVNPKRWSVPSGLGKRLHGALVALALLVVPVAALAQSSDATLYYLVPSDGTLTPAFAGGTFSYTASVPYATASMTVTPYATDPSATVTVNGTPVTYGYPSAPISLSPGPNVITTVVVSADTTATNTYTLTVTREVPSSNADLASLVPSDGTLTPAFASNIFSYTASVPYATASMTVTPTAADSSATIAVNGGPVASGTPSGSISLGVGDTNVIIAVVTAGDGITTNTYTLTVTRTAPGTNAYLANLVPSAGTLAPVFASNIFSYVASVPYATNSITLTPTAADAGATITVNGNPVTSGSRSGAISLSMGDNVISTLVTAEDGSTTNAYTLTVTRGLGSTWANANVTGTPASPLNWFNSPQGTWTDGTPVSTNTGTIQYFQDAATALGNTVGATQNSVIDNGGVPFQLGTLTLSGKASATANANLTNTITATGGNALNFSAATGTINLNAVNATRTLIYNLNCPIQLGTAGSATALTLTGNGSSTFNINGVISELQPGGGSLVKSGSSTVTLSANNTFSGGLTLNAGTLTLSGSNSFAGNTVIYGGTLANLTANSLGTGTNIIFAGNGTISPGYNVNPVLAKGVTINTNVTATVSLGSQFYKITFSGPLAGSGTNYVLGGGGGANGAATFSSPSNTFTGTLAVSSQGNGAVPLTVNSLPDSPNPIQLSGTSYQSTFALGAGTATPLLFNQRQIQFNGPKGGIIQNNNATAANTITINTDLLITSNAVHTLTLGGANTGNNAFNGKIGDAPGGQATSLTAAGGLWGVSASNTFTGPVTVSGGTLSLPWLDLAANPNPLGQSANTAANLLLADTTTLRYTGGAAACDRLFTLNSTAATKAVTLDASGTGPVNFNNAGAVAYGTAASGKTRTLALAGSNTDTNTLAASIADNGLSVVNVTKSGTGTWLLSGASTYSGTTTVSAGKLLIYGDLSGATNTVTVATNATLGGTGTLGGSVTVAKGGNLAPGASVGTLTIKSNLDVSALAAGTTGKLYYELGPTNASDQLVVGGTLTIGSGVLGFSDFVFTNVGGLQVGTYELITTSGGLSGTLNSTDLAGTVGTLTGTLQITGNNLELVVTAGVVLPPVVALTSPTNSQQFVATASIPLTASVTDNGHTVSQVNYYSGASLVGSSSTGPSYSATWPGVAGGSYSLTAVAVYDGSLTVTSAPPVNIVVLGTPSVSSFGPRSGSSFPLTFSGPSGQTYKVLSSTNVALPLPNWTVLSSGTFAGSAVNYTDTGATNARQFYRIQSP